MQFTIEQFHYLNADKYLSFEELNNLPDYLKGMIVSYGIDDTQVRDELYALGLIKE